MSRHHHKHSDHILGIDIGGSGIKAAPVDIKTGEFASDRRRVATPDSGEPEAIVEIARGLCADFDWHGPVGCAFPGVIRKGHTLTAANLNPAWVGVNADKVFSKALDNPVTMINDADAAGLAEVKLGAAKGIDGVVVMITLGTGIGTAVFVDGRLVPNTEFGHLQMGGVEAEDLASSRAKNDDNIGFGEWSKRVESFLKEMERLFWPDLFVIGGGISKNFDRFGPRIRVDTPVVQAKLQNRAGIVGAALAAHRRR